jgi:hypothetical protein
MAENSKASSSGGGLTQTNGKGIGFGYVMKSSYFIMNVIAIVIYPLLRLIGLR